MVDKRSFTFEEPHQSYESSRMVVLFRGSDRGRQVVCPISREVLDDHFQGTRKDPLAAFTAHKKTIEHLARRKYLGGQLEADGSVLIGECTSSDSATCSLATHYACLAGTSEGQ